MCLQARQLEKKRQKMAHHLDDKNKLLLEGPGSNPTEGYGTGENVFVWMRYLCLICVCCVEGEKGASHLKL